MDDMLEQMPNGPLPGLTPRTGPATVQDTAGSPLPAAAIDKLAASGQVPPGMSVTRQLAEPLWRARGWMKFTGVLLLIYGVFCILGIWTIVICWLPIWLGLILISGSNHIRHAAVMDSEANLKASLDKIGLFFRIWGITTLVGLILGIVALIFWAVTGGAAMMVSLMTHQAMVQ